jgi:Zn-dependent protease with chaperone function
LACEHGALSDVRALYFDGKSSDGHKVTLEVGAQGALRVRGAGIDLGWPLAEVRISDRIGSSRRYLYFPDGSQCETGDNDAVDRLFASQGPAAARLLHRLESRLRYAIAALVITVAAVGAFVAWGIPALAKQVAFRLPAATETLIGRDALAALDRFVLQPSRLPPGRQAALRKLHAGMIADNGSDSGAASAYRLEFRKGGRVGANALALPAGIIVVTDELVELAKDDREIEAVLAHEIGHLRQRHILRHMLQDSATALVIAVTIGDVASLTSLAAAAPSLLLQAKFSRDFEREADDFALAYLARRGIPPEMFSAILQRMEEKRPGGKDAPDYLSTHPATRERIERALGKR